MRNPIALPCLKGICLIKFMLRDGPRHQRRKISRIFIIKSFSYCLQDAVWRFQILCVTFQNLAANMELYLSSFVKKPGLNIKFCLPRYIYISRISSSSWLSVIVKADYRYKLAQQLIFLSLLHDDKKSQCNNCDVNYFQNKF